MEQLMNQVLDIPLEDMVCLVTHNALILVDERKASGSNPRPRHLMSILQRVRALTSYLLSLQD